MFKPRYVRHSTWVSKLISGKEFLTKFNYYHVIGAFLHSWGSCGNKDYFYKIMALFLTKTLFLFCSKFTTFERYYIGTGKNIIRVSGSRL